MNTIRIKRKINSTLLRIKELEQYKGKNIELEIKVKEFPMKNKDKKIKSLAGILSNYADITLRNKENNAWRLAVREKHENYRR